MSGNLVAADRTNRSIWADSVALQRAIVAQKASSLQAGGQQAMPKVGDERLFSAADPLPWVPDQVGSRFSSDQHSLLVVASSYNGFIQGYSGRDAVMPLSDYVAAKKAGADGLGTFISKFKEHVVDRDKAYYQPILRDLLSASGCFPEDCCLTDLCKASFVLRGNGADEGNRGDKGDDSVVKKHWLHWIPYVAGMPVGQGDAPLPYDWLWQRMQQCRVIVALGTIAEYGVLKVFQSMAVAPKAWSWKDIKVAPDHPTMNAKTGDWKYAYACSRRKLRDWLTDEDWWVLGDAGGRSRWFLLPVHHPSSAIGRGKDSRYLKTAPRLRGMMKEAGKALG